MSRVLDFLAILGAFMILNACSSNVGSDVSGSTGNSPPLIVGDGTGQIDAGEPVVLEWNDLESDVELVSVEVSYDGGQTWQSVETGVPNNGSYTFLAPSVPGATFRIRIVEEGGEVLAESDDIEVTGTAATPTPTPIPAPTPPPDTFAFESIGGFLKPSGWNMQGLERPDDLTYWRNQKRDGLLRKPIDVKVDPPTNRILVLSDRTISAFDLTSGEYLGRINGKRSGGGTCDYSPSYSGFCIGGNSDTETHDGGIWNDAWGFAVDSDNRKIFLADDHRRITRFDLDTGEFDGAIGKLGSYIRSTKKMVRSPSFSISAWYKNNTSDGGHVIGYTQGHYGSDSHGRHIFMQTDGRVRFGIYNGSSVQTVVSPLAYNDGDWHHFVGTFAPGRLTLYVNGSQVAQTTSDVDSAQSMDGYWMMGLNRDSWANTASGKFHAQSIDNVAIWNVELDSSDVSTVFSQEEPTESFPKWNRVVSAWNFNEASGREFSDLTSAGNTAILDGNGVSGVTGKNDKGVELKAGVLNTGWAMSTAFEDSDERGGFSSKLISVGYNQGKLYVAQWGWIERFDAETGIYEAGLGRATASTGSCPNPGVAPGWCTGGTFGTGGGDGEFQYIVGMAFDNDNDFMYLADLTEKRVVKHVLSTGAFVGAIGRMDSSTGTCPATPGPAPGWCTGGDSVGGNEDGEFDRAYGVAIDVPNDALYVSDKSMESVQKRVLSTGAYIGEVGYSSSTTGTCPSLGLANSWCTGGSFSSGTYDTLAGSHNELSTIAFHDGKIYAPSKESGRVTRIDAGTGAFEGAIGIPVLTKDSTWTETTATFTTEINKGIGNLFNAPVGIAMNEVSGHFFVADVSDHNITKHLISTGELVGMIGNIRDSEGTCVADAVANGWCTGGDSASGSEDAALNGPRSVVVDVDGDWLYVVQSDRIKKFQMSTGQFEGAIGNLTSSTGTCSSPGAANAWCTGGVFGSGGGDGMFNGARGSALDTGSDHLYIADYDNHRIVKLRASTGEFLGAMGKVSVTGGDCLSTGYSGWCSGGTFEAGSLNGELDRPVSIGLDLTNRILLVFDRNNRISRYELDSGNYLGSIGYLLGKNDAGGTCADEPGVTTEWCTGGLFSGGSSTEPTILQSDSLGYEMVVDPANDEFFIALDQVDTINRYRLSNGEYLGSLGWVVETGGTCTSLGYHGKFCKGGKFDEHWISGSFDQPRGLARDSQGNFYVVESENARVTRVTAPENR